jgi:hypothetical protein
MPILHVSWVYSKIWEKGKIGLKPELIDIPEPSILQAFSEDIEKKLTDAFPWKDS